LGLGAVQHAAVWLVLICSILLSQAQTEKQKKEDEKEEYKHRADILIGLATYTVWAAPGAFGSTNADLVVGLFVPDDLWSTFEVLRQKPIQGHRVKLMRPNSEEEARKCQLLYIASSKQEVAQGILTKLKTACILTVGENESFATNGGAVALVGGYIRTSESIKFDFQLEVHRPSAAQKHLQFNSHFLREYMKILEGK
jgi:hypothetical protein